MNDSFSRYKQLLKEKYEMEKMGENADFLALPTPARLRDLTIYLLEETTSANDLNVFEKFMGFTFNAVNRNKINAKIDKFRPLINFMKNKSELNDIKSADMLAVLLRSEPRPYRKFLRSMTDNTDEINKSENKNSSETEENGAIDTGDVNDLEGQQEDDGKQVINPVMGIPFDTYKPSILKKWVQNVKNYALGIAGATLLGTSGFYYMKSAEKNCMVWQEFEFVRESCDYIGKNPVPLDEDKLKNFKKIKVNCNTKFFDEKGNPLVWYCKMQDGSLEYFTQLGLHPINGKTLKSITEYIIRKYVC